MTARADHPDLALRRAFRSGDVEAYRVLVTPHLDAVYSLCRRLLRRPADAEDAAQESLIKALDRHAQYDPERPFRAWLLTIAANECRDRMRKVWWHRVVSLVSPRWAEEPSPEQACATDRRDARLRAEVDALPEPYREAVLLFHFAELGYEEMSEITGVGVSALKQRVRRGRALLLERQPELLGALDDAVLYLECSTDRTVGEGG